MPFLYVTSPDVGDPPPEGIPWQVDWRRPLGFEMQLSHLKRLFAVDYLKGAGLAGFVLEGDDGHRLDLAKTPPDLGLVRSGLVVFRRAACDPAQQHQGDGCPTAGLPGSAEKDAGAEAVQECPYAQPAAWHAKADAQLRQTTGRIPDWRGALRSSVDVRQRVPRVATSAPSSCLTFPLTPASASYSSVPPEGATTSLSLRPGGRQPSSGPRLPSPAESLFSLRSAGGYVSPVVTPDVGRTDPLVLDHVPGFLVGDEVEAMAVPSHPGLHGQRGEVEGCEMRGGIVHVVALFAPPFNTVSLEVRYLQNMSELRREAA